MDEPERAASAPPPEWVAALPPPPFVDPGSYPAHPRLVPLSPRVAVLIAAWVKVRAVRGAPAATSGIDKRLERMEQAIESVAVEVERISEAQRFTAALMSERTPSKEMDSREGRGALPPVPRIITPH